MKKRMATVGVADTRRSLLRGDGAEREVVVLMKADWWVKRDVEGAVRHLSELAKAGGKGAQSYKRTLALLRDLGEAQSAAEHMSHCGRAGDVE